jgi:hypothetical protein
MTKVSKTRVVALSETRKITVTERIYPATGQYCDSDADTIIDDSMYEIEIVASEKDHKVRMFFKADAVLTSAEEVREQLDSMSSLIVAIEKARANFARHAVHVGIIP